MINFFRKTRKKLAAENKFIQYSRYAIGEILLVVIGILIALSINNWNEDRKDAILEKYYLKRLIDDLEADIAEIEETVKYASEYIVIGNNILELLGQNYISDIIKSPDSTNVDFIENALNHYDKNMH